MKVIGILSIFHSVCSLCREELHNSVCHGRFSVTIVALLFERLLVLIRFIAA